jgi:hypothetical protein
MKRLIPILAAIIILSSCQYIPGTQASQSKKIMENISSNFKTDAAFKIEEMEISAKIEAASPDSCAITITSPQELTGFTYLIYQDGVKVSHLGLEFSLQNSGAVRASPLIEVASSLATLLRMGKESPPTKAEDGCWQLSANLSNGEAALCLEDETGNPKKLSLQGGAFIITLENFVFLS